MWQECDVFENVTSLPARPPARPVKKSQLNSRMCAQDTHEITVN